MVLCKWKNMNLQSILANSCLSNLFQNKHRDTNSRNNFLNFKSHGEKLEKDTFLKGADVSVQHNQSFLKADLSAEKLTVLLQGADVSVQYNQSFVLKGQTSLYSIISS